MKLHIVSHPDPLPSTGGGLVDLDDAPLDDAALARLEADLTGARGAPPWRMRKRVELRELLALAARAPRLEVLDVDSRTDLLVTIRLHAPVPFMKPGRGAVPVGGRAGSGCAHGVAEQATVAIHYPEALLTQPRSGVGIVRFVEPRGIWHPNVSYDGKGMLCLGGTVLRGTPLRELVLMAYAAATLQASTRDSRASGGVMNADALRYWQARSNSVPLTRDPILAPVRPVGEQLSGANGGESA